jgi:hypothetical protein
MSKTKTDLTTYNEDALSFFVLNNNKFKRVFIMSDSNDFDEVILPMVDENYIYTTQQLETLKIKWSKY